MPFSQRCGRLAWALMLCCIGAFCARAAEMPNPFPPADVSVTTLANGVRLVVKEDHSLPIVAVVVAVHGGSGAEAGNRGAAHVLEHLLFQGTKRYPEALAPQAALEQVGGISNAITSRDALRIQAAIPAAKADLLVNVLYDLVMQPLLSDARFEKERATILAEIQDEADDPVTSALGAGYLCSYTAHPYRYAPSGSVNDLLWLTLPQVRAYQKRWFVAKNISLVFVGDITLAKAKALVSANFGKAPASAPPALPPAETAPHPVGRLHVKGPQAATWQAMAFAAPPSSNFTAMVATDVLLTLLVDGPDSILPEWYARQGVSPTDFGGEFVSTRAPGRLLIWAQTRPDKAVPLREATLGLLKRIEAGELDTEALELARRRLALAFVLDNESYLQQASTLAFYESLGGAKLACRYIPTINAITTEQVSAAAPTTLQGWATTGTAPEGGR